ncbi:tetratricopeptide repeat protein [Candidatus Dojkabacteria bacterium]|nr:tetratricopeptide repeat protein [Candidatus Dojkabacteria bacterium]
MSTKTKSNTNLIIFIGIFFLLLICGLLCCAPTFFALVAQNFDTSLDITNDYESKSLKDSTQFDKNDNEATYFLLKDLSSKAVDLYYKAEDLDAEGNYAEAYETTNKALEYDPEEPALLDMKCYILIHLNELEQALETCQKVYREYPNSPFTLSKLAQIHYLQDECKQVVKYSKELANLEDIDEMDKRKLYGNAGIFLTDCNGDKELARELLTEASKRSIDPEIKEVYEERLNLLNESYTSK